MDSDTNNKTIAQAIDDINPPQLLCPTCGKQFPTPKGLRTHQWTHVPKLPKPPKEEWGEKDDIRRAFQTIAAIHLNKVPLKNRFAICLPGLRASHEAELLSNPGFAKIHMVDRSANAVKLGLLAGYDIEKANFMTVLTRLVNTGAKLSLIDYDGYVVSYADGLALINAVQKCALTDTAVIRMASLKRNHDQVSGDENLEAIGQNIIGNLPTNYKLISTANTTYSGKRCTPVVLYQWVVHKTPT